jgi:hypothetical protein
LDMVHWDGDSVGRKDMDREDGRYPRGVRLRLGEIVTVESRISNGCTGVSK